MTHQEPSTVFHVRTGKPGGQFARILEFCRLDVCRLRRQYLVCRQSFALRTFWRLGRPNPKSHFRRGTSGDWKNHFCDDLKRSFKSCYGQALFDAGYEHDDRW